MVVAKGRADVSFMLNLFRAVVLVGMLVLAYWIGRSILSIAIGIVVSRYVTDPFIHLYMYKYFGINYREIIKHLMKIVSFTALMSIGVFSVGFLNLNKILRLSNLNELVSNVSFHITWIANFGIWRRDFESLEDKDRYAHLQFVQVDWTIRVFNKKL